MPPQNEENNWQFDHKIWINHWLRWITSAPVISKRNRVGAFMEYKEFSFFPLCKDFYFYTELSFSKTTKKYILKIAADWLKYCGIYRFVQTWTNGNCFSFVIKRSWICSPTIIWPERVRTSFSSQFIALNTVVGVQSLSAARSVLQWIRRVDTQLNFLHISWALTFFSRFFSRTAQWIIYRWRASMKQYKILLKFFGSSVSSAISSVRCCWFVHLYQNWKLS